MIETIRYTREQRHFRSRRPVMVQFACQCGVLFLCALLCYSQTKPSLELDVTKIGLRPRSEVIKILGRPESRDLDMDNYSWGFVGYAHGILDQIDYGFKTRASSTKEALAKVGLEQTSSPKKGPLSYYWNSSTGGPLTCCGFVMDNVVIPLGFSGVLVGFKDKLTANQTQLEAAAKKKAQGSLGARIAYARFLTEYFAKIGRQTIHVSAIDENQQTLDVFSGLIEKLSEVRHPTSSPLGKSWSPPIQRLC
jgi:hypothetical protein